MKLALFLLAVLPSIEANWGQCREANWKGKFNKKSWVRCDHSTEYMTGLYRTDGNNGEISLIEKAMCCQAPSPNQHQQSFCKKADWWKTLDRSVTSRLFAITFLKIFTGNFVLARVVIVIALVYIWKVISSFIKRNLNECNNNPCKNEATCENLQESYRCKCKPGFTNKNCQTGNCFFT